MTKVQIKARFASAQETANVLGVSTPRFKKLVKLADSNSALKFKAPTSWNGLNKDRKSSQKSYWVLMRAKSGSTKSEDKVGSQKRKATQKSRASGKRQARGKVSKGTR